jgi:hypothetical protein
MRARRWLAPAILAATLAAIAAGGGEARAAGSSCPDSNPPNELVLVGGSGQTAQLGTPFAANLQVELANSNGCPLTGDLAGVDVEFDAPGSGASGIFAGSGSAEASVGTDAQGVATAPALTADFTAGSYTVAAHSAYGSVELSLTNTAAGLPAAIAAATASPQTATVNGRYARPLQASVTDANGNPVQGAGVSFVIGSGAAGATAAFLGGGAQATELTGSNGIATSPALQAGETAGSFTVFASVGASPDLATFRLRATPAKPAAIAAGAASGESTPIRTRFRVPLAVTVTDRYGNPVAGGVVVFTAPRRGPGGTFAIRSRRSKRSHASRVARVRTGSNGIAVAPRFVANRIAGGYVVRAAIRGVRARASFALVNDPRR